MKVIERFQIQTVNHKIENSHLGHEHQFLSNPEREHLRLVSYLHRSVMRGAVDSHTPSTDRHREFHILTMWYQLVRTLAIT